MTTQTEAKPAKTQTLKFKYVVTEEQLAHLKKLARITAPKPEGQSISDFMGLLVSEGIRTIDLQLAAQRKQLEDADKAAAVKSEAGDADKSSKGADIVQAAPADGGAP